MPASSPDRLLDRIAQKKPVAVIVLEGTDVYLRDRCRSKLIEAYVSPTARDWAVTRLSARDDGWDEILARAETRPMMSNHQVVIAQGGESIEKLGEKSRDEIVQAFERYLESPPPFSTLIIETAVLDRRQRFTKVLDQNNNVLVVKLEIGAESALVLAAQMAKELGSEIDRDAAALLANMLDGSPARMEIELEKLATYAPRRRITKGDVELLVVAARKNTVFQLADMLATRRRADAFAFLDNLIREGEEPAGMIGALAWRYRQLIETRDYRHSKGDLLTGLVALAEADSELKSANANPRATMEFLIARLTSRATGRP